MLDYDGLSLREAEAQPVPTAPWLETSRITTPQEATDFVRSYLTLYPAPQQPLGALGLTSMS